MNLEEIKTKLKELALKRTTPFCYMCYQDCPSGRCKDCGSDDLMRHLDGHGVEYGTEWVIEAILQEELAEANLDEIFEQMIDECYGEQIQIGFLTLNPSVAIKSLDPIAWNIARSEYIDSLTSDEDLIEIGNSYYWNHDLEELIS